MRVPGRDADELWSVSSVVLAHDVAQIYDGVIAEHLCADHSFRALSYLAREPNFTVLEQKQVEFETSLDLLHHAWQSENDLELLHRITVLAQSVAPLEHFHGLVAHSDAS